MRILLGVPVHQDEDIFREYLESLDRLHMPDGVTMDRVFYLHNCPHLGQMLKPTDKVLYNDTPANYNTSGATHEWKPENLREVARMKNEMIRMAIAGDYDYYFLVDSDLILHPDTLRRLINCEKEIVAEVFWTEWVKGTGEILPNCWDSDASTFHKVKKYAVPKLHTTGGTGALILIKREVLLAGVDYTPIYNVSFSVYEDRAFSIRAACAGYQMHIDTTLPARHLYRRSDYEKYVRKKVARK